jgi:hypothetical protein
VIGPADLAALLRDCLRLWEVAGKVEADETGVRILRAEGAYVVSRGRAPARWLLATPQRTAAGRGARPAASVVALLSTLRAALGVAPGTKLRVGG